MKVRRSWLVPFVFVAVGVVMGIVVASDMGWLSNGTAGPDQMPNGIVRPITTAPQLPMAGGNAKNFVEIAKTVKPAVVNIAASRSGKGDGPQSSPFDDPFFRKFFGDEFFKRDQPHRERKRAWTGFRGNR